MFESFNRLPFSQRVSFLLILLFAILTPTFYLVANQPADVRSRAEMSNIQSQTLTSMPDVDPQTLEYYDFQIDAYPVKTITRTEPGPKYLAELVLQVHGSRINNTQQLYGFIQQPATPYESTQINFTFQEFNFPRFKSDPINLIYNQCVDLYKSTSKDLSNYIATFCYRITFVEPGTGIKRAYSPPANPFIDFSYNGIKTATIVSFSTAFNKYNNPSPYDGINIRGSRVNYFTIDVDSTLNNFTSVNYYIDGLFEGLSNLDTAKLCTISTSYPNKYLKQTWAPKPEGGSSFLITEKVGYCSYKYLSSFLKPAYISLYMDGGIPLPTISPTISINPSTLPSVAPSPTITPIIVPSPTTTLITPTSSNNQLPFIQTNSLPTAKKGRYYGLSINGYDNNISDILTMSIAGLPLGISKGNCISRITLNRKYISCPISGTPTVIGLNTVAITLQDNKGGSIRKILTLRVN